MDLILKREEFTADGIFGQILDANNKHLFYSLEHSYDTGHGIGTFEPKVPPGHYTCVKGKHQLKHMTLPFITFEIMKVPNHSGILFHVGNYHRDSSGCILLGTNRSLNSNPPCITKSQFAFDKFMELNKNLNEFKLTVL